jgi:ribosomal protein S18 acetylase RimI-like enzyme
VPLRVREAEPGDAQALEPLLEQLGYPASTEAVAARLARLGASDADCVLVAEDDGHVVGLATLHVSESLAYDHPAARISMIVVDGARRRGGIGSRLVAELEAEARRRDCCLLYLTTAERRADARAFYRRLGFEETGRRFAKALETLGN